MQHIHKSVLINSIVTSLQKANGIVDCQHAAISSTNDFIDPLSACNSYTIERTAETNTEQDEDVDHSEVILDLHFTLAEAKTNKPQLTN